MGLGHPVRGLRARMFLCSQDLGLWGGFGQQDRLNDRFLLQKSPTKQMIFYSSQPPHSICAQRGSDYIFFADSFRTFILCPFGQQDLGLIPVGCAADAKQNRSTVLLAVTKLRNDLKSLSNDWVNPPLPPPFRFHIPDRQNSPSVNMHLYIYTCVDTYIHNYRHAIYVCMYFYMCTCVGS